MDTTSDHSRGRPGKLCEVPSSDSEYISTPIFTAQPMGPSQELVHVPGQPRSIYSHPCFSKGKGGRKARAAALQGADGKHSPPTIPSPSQCRQTHFRSHGSGTHTSQLSPTPCWGKRPKSCISHGNMNVRRIHRIPNSAG